MKILLSGIAAFVCVFTSGAAVAQAAPDPPVTIVPPVEGYVWASKPTVADYIAATGYEHNSAGGTVQVTRQGLGRYAVRFDNMGVQGGIAHASAYGGNNICVVSAWGPVAGDEFVTVLCFTPAGAPVDSRFIAYVSNRKDGAARGYVFSWTANVPAGGYTPPAAFSHDSTGQPIAVFGEGTGRYAVELGAFAQDVAAGVWKSGSLRVSANGTTAATCQVMDPAFVAVDPGVLRVRCYNATGNPVNSKFTLSYSRGVVPLSATVDNSGAAPVAAGWSGVAPAVTEVDDGDYVVAYPGAGAAGGHAFATIMGTPPMYCTIFSWYVSGGAMNLRVRCYQPGGGQLNPAMLFSVGFLT